MSGMLSCILFSASLFSRALSEHVLSSTQSPGGPCGILCSCTEKDNILYLNCKERNINNIAKIKVPPAIPFYLDLYKNDLVELLPGDLIGLKNALSLNLGANSIQQLEPRVFHALGFLKKLHINSNFLVTLKEDTFLGLVNLEYLQLDTNFIQVIEPGAFSKLVRLKVLILNDNSITVLPRNIFRFVPLTHLDLRGNQLQSLPYVGFLEHTGRIVELLLEDNKWACNCQILPLKIWRDTMVAQSSISEVVCDSPDFLKGSALSKIKKNDFCPVFNDTSLEESSKSVDMFVTSSSKVITLTNPRDDETLARIQTSDPVCVEQCSCFNSSPADFLIHCEDKGIKRISELGFVHQSPTNLVLAGNLIQRLFQDDFVAYERLVLLNLANNKIDYIDRETFLGLALLQKLHLNGNRLNQLTSGMFVGLNSLEHLYLENNVIKDIQPGAFQALPNLKILSLNNNILQTLPSQIFHHVPIIQLNLMNNAFRHLPAINVLDQLVALRLIFLDNNPWNCSCNLIDFKQWLETLRKGTVGGDILCQTPKEIAETELESVSQEVMCPGLATFTPMPYHMLPQVMTFPSTTISSKGYRHFFTDVVPLSVSILCLLILFILVIFSTAGIVVLVVQRKRRPQKRPMEDRPRESGPAELEHHICSQKNSCPLARQSIMNMYLEPIYGPALTGCHNHNCSTCPKYKKIQDYGLTEAKSPYRFIKGKETENDSPLAWQDLKFMVMKHYASDFITNDKPGSLYQNVFENEQENQKTGITEYFKKSMHQLQPALEFQSQNQQKELKLFQTLVCTTRQGVMVDPTHNERFELKGSSRSDCDYLEVLEH